MMLWPNNFRRSASFFAGALLIFSFSNVALSQSLEFFLESAAERDPTYRQVVADYNARLASSSAVRSNLLPKAELIGRSSDSVGTYTSFSRTTSRKFTSGELALRVTQSLYNPALSIASEQANLQDLQAIAAVEDAFQDLTYRVVQAYLELIFSIERVHLLENQQLMVADQMASANARYRAGRASLADILEAQTRVDTLIPQVASAKGEKTIKAATLRSVAGLLNHPAISPVIDADISTLPAQGVWDAIMNSCNPELKRIRLAGEITKLELQKVGAEYKPVAEVFFNYGLSSYPRGVIDSLADRKISVAALGIQVNVPLFSGFSTKNKVQEVLFKVESANAQYEKKERELKLQLETAYISVSSSLQQSVLLAKAVETAKASVDANRLGFEAGFRVSFDVLNSQAQLFGLLQNLAFARYTGLSQLAALKRAAGTLSSISPLSVTADQANISACD